MHIKHIHETIEKLSQYACEEVCKSKEAINTEELGEVIDMVKDLASAEKDARIAKAMEEADEEEKEEIKYIIKKMKEEGEEWGEEEARRFYRWQPRSKTSGRYMSRGDGRRRGYGNPMYYGMMPEVYNPMEWNMGMEQDGMNRMHYGGSGSSSGNGSSGGSRNYSDGYSEGETRGYQKGYEEGDSTGYRRGYSEGQKDGSRNGGSQSRMESARKNYDDMRRNHSESTPQTNSEKAKKLENLLGEVEIYLNSQKPGMSPEEKTVMRTKLQKMAQSLPA